eukprot:697945-Ditylum_brightwellii.AAC.1
MWGPGSGARTQLGRPGIGTYVPVLALLLFGTTQGWSGGYEQEICRNVLYGIVSFALVRSPK